MSNDGAAKVITLLIGSVYVYCAIVAAVLLVAGILVGKYLI